MGEGLASLARASSTSRLCLTPTSRCLAPLKGNKGGRYARDRSIARSLATHKHMRLLILVAAT
eukprot:5752030-Ditylum_brightwellii.AAC.1